MVVSTMQAWEILYFLLKQRVVLYTFQIYEAHLFGFSHILADIRTTEAFDREGSASGGEDMVGKGVGSRERADTLGGEF
jgi:hypothetical protein